MPLMACPTSGLKPSLDGLPPSHIDASQEATPLAMAVENNMLAPLKVLLAKLDNPPITCLVSDVFMRFTITAAEELGLPIVMLVTMSACGYMGFKQLHDLREKGFLPLKGTNLVVEVTGHVVDLVLILGLVNKDQANCALKTFQESFCKIMRHFY